MIAAAAVRSKHKDNHKHWFADRILKLPEGRCGHAQIQHVPFIDTLFFSCSCCRRLLFSGCSKYKMEAIRPLSSGTRALAVSYPYIRSLVGIPRKYVPATHTTAKVNQGRC